MNRLRLFSRLLVLCPPLHACIIKKVDVARLSFKERHKVTESSLSRSVVHVSTTLSVVCHESTFPAAMPRSMTLPKIL